MNSIHLGICKARGKTLSLFKKSVLSLLFLVGSFASAQQSVSGTVADPSGVPLPGVNVVIKGTNTGASTDFDGNFSIQAAETDVLIFSFVGFKDQEATVGNNTSFSISLEEEASFLDEIIVTGYGTQTRREVTASIVRVDSETIERVAAGSSIDAIKGQVAGVDITSQGGRPGQSPQVQIRGRRSISASNDPLYVVDGIPVTSSVDGGAIFDIAPQDIESMEILKDAAATAIYGSRGANGVIIITTKRGKQGEQTQVSYSGYYGTTEVLNVPDMMNAEEYKNMRAEAFRKNSSSEFSWDGQTESDLYILFDGEQALVDNYTAGKDFRYLDAVLQKGSQQSHQISARGGTEKTAYNASVGYFSEEGIVPGMDYERINARLNLDHRINDMFKFGMSTTLTQATNNWGSNAVMNEALRNLPIGRPYLDDGVTPRMFTWNDGIATNPLAEIVPGAYIDERLSTRIFLPTYLEVTFNPDLKFTTTFGPDLRFVRRGEFRGAGTNDNRMGPADAETETRREQGFTLENLITYNKEIGPGRLKVTLLQSIQEFTSETGKAEVLNLPYESQLWYNIGTAAVKGNLSSSLSEWQLQSYMGRVNYDINGKYLFQASLRGDGSSRLSEGNKWAYFPGVSAGWRINEESFMADAPFDELKLRLSYGEVGNTAISPYQTQGGLARTVYSWGGSSAFGYRVNDIPNAELGWEISKTIDLGVDFTLMNGNISGTFDVYQTKTSDLILARNLPWTSGYESVFQNVGSTETNGVEFGVNAVILDNPDGLNFDVNFNISSYDEKITELALKDASGNPADDVGNEWFIGQPVRVFYNYEYGGIYKTSEAALAQSLEGKVPGVIARKDSNGDGQITPDDRSVLGSDVPDYFGGITTNFSYGNWDLSAFFYFKQGQMIQSNFHRGNNSLQGRYNNLDVDYWTPDNQDARYPRPSIGNEGAIDGELLQYFDGSFVKLRNLTLGYNVDSEVASSIGMRNLRVYLQGQNLWFSSDYETFDPEIGAQRIDSGVAPSSSMWAFGVRANF
jgi:TonB-linked SusC/RagA family outer membrane protein|tara:strand:- start:3054 stop:6122 length:3069 start_codon:yes stop_codon:yes gene_type:complete